MSFSTGNVKTKNFLCFMVYGYAYYYLTKLETGDDWYQHIPLLSITDIFRFKFRNMFVLIIVTLFVMTEPCSCVFFIYGFCIIYNPETYFCIFELI